jgi:hypothetical protein
MNVKKEQRRFQRRQYRKKLKYAFAKWFVNVVLRREVSFTGCTRVVIIGKNKVVKMPRIGCLKALFKGWLCNIDEAENWRLLDLFYENTLADGRPAKVKFAPVLKTYFFGFFEVMQRAEPVTPAEIDAAIAEWKSLDDWKSLCDFCTDVNNDNFGRLNGEIVIIDYAQ